MQALLSSPVTFRDACALAWAQAHLSAYLSKHPNAKYEDSFKIFAEYYDSGRYVADHLSEFINNSDSPSDELRDADI